LKIKKTPNPLPLNTLPTHLWKGGEKEKKYHPPPSHPTPLHPRNNSLET
jgi:hypothetical protein